MGSNEFKYDKYQESDTVKQAEAALNAQLAQKPGAYQSQWKTQLDEVINKIMNREKFSYDLNGDALYQQYKDKYIQQGKMAMGDAIGKASAMTGGYGNSYAQGVGQQAYQAQLENLNDVVPELYQMAYDKYNQEGQDLYNQYAMLGDREEQDYGRHRDSVGDWQTERDYLAGRYDSERDRDYEKYGDDKAYAYQEHRNDITDEQWRKEFEEAQRQFNEQMALKNGSSGGGSSSGGSSGGNSSSDGSLGKDDSPKYTYEETPAVTSFVARIRTQSEFGRAGNSDKAKYGNYKSYVKGMLEKYQDELTDNDIATISQKFGL